MKVIIHEEIFIWTYSFGTQMKHKSLRLKAYLPHKPANSTKLCQNLGKKAEFLAGLLSKATR
jgi:hypothetical protein